MCTLYVHYMFSQYLVGNVFSNCIYLLIQIIRHSKHSNLEKIEIEKTENNQICNVPLISEFL